MIGAGLRAQVAADLHGFGVSRSKADSGTYRVVLRGISMERLLWAFCLSLR